MHIDATLQNELITILLEGVVLTDSLSGRDVLLTGIPQYKSWTRVPDNQLADLTKIVDYSAQTFVGEDESLENWSLLILIDNAIHHTKGLSASSKLEKIRGKVVSYWHEHHKDASKTTLQNSIQDSNKQILSFPTIEKQRNSVEDPLHVITNHISQVKAALTQAIQPFEYIYVVRAEPAEYREVLTCLDQALRELDQLSLYIEGLGRSEIITQSYSFKVHLLREEVVYIKEQIQTVKKWIDLNKAHPIIKNKLTGIQQRVDALL